jgi:hypothetical protein
MLQIHLTPIKVERVLFIADSVIEEDADIATWRAIRPLVDQINLLLKGIGQEIAREKVEPLRK